MKQVNAVKMNRFFILSILIILLNGCQTQKNKDRIIFEFIESIHKKEFEKAYNFLDKTVINNQTRKEIFDYFNESNLVLQKFEMPNFEDFEAIYKESFISGDKPKNQFEIPFPFLTNIGLAPKIILQISYDENRATITSFKILNMPDLNNVANISKDAYPEKRESFNLELKDILKYRIYFAENPNGESVKVKSSFLQEEKNEDIEKGIRNLLTTLNKVSIKKSSKSVSQDYEPDNLKAIFLTWKGEEPNTIFEIIVNKDQVETLTISEGRFVNAQIFYEIENKDKAKVFNLINHLISIVE